MWAIIGGSGFENFPEFQVIEELPGETPFGFASSGAKRVNLAGTEIIFISRHGKHHEVSPSEINYRANIFLLKQLGVTKILSISAVGSLREELKPGDLVVPTQYIDRTKGLRAHTFAGQGIVSHVSIAEPVAMHLVEELKKYTSGFNFTSHFGRTYVTIEGPTFSTKAESNYYRLIGADIIGMTNFPEYALAREAGICYLPCSFVTDYDCWREGADHVTVEEVTRVMKLNRLKAFELAKTFIPATTEQFPDGCANIGICTGIMSKTDLLNADQLKLLDVFNQ